ncbi:hypothetical protein NUSPORA_02291 [Nucleospora cyclopteri]
MKDSKQNTINQCPSENKEETKHIKIRLESPTGQGIQVSTKKTNRVQKLLEAFCKAKKVNSNEYRLVFNNEFLSEGRSLESYKINDGDVIRVMAQQTGG